MKVGICKDTIYELRREIMRNYLEIKDTANPTILLSAFSQAAEVTWRASQGLPRQARQCIQYQAWGPSTLIPRGWFRSLDNIVAINDYVSRLACGLDPIKGFSSSNADVRWIEGEGVVSHPWASTYADDILRTGKDFQNTYLGKP